MGIPHDSPQRVKAGLQFTLSEATGDGHCFLPEQQLIAEALKILQEALTPASPDVPERRFGGRIFGVGDKITQIRNNYDKGANGVFNGIQGVVSAIDLVDQTLTVCTDEDVDYEFSELDELTHAYAVNIHRSQGSEYPCVVLPITTRAWMMLQRNLLYTAVTRAKKLVVWPL